MEDTRPLRTQISAILNDCDYEQTRQVYEFCKQISGRARAGAPTVQGAVAEKPVQQDANVEIDYLCGRWMHKAGVVSQWLYDAFFAGKRSETYDEVSNMVKICYAASCPIRLVAAEDKEVVGTISIVKRDCDDKDYGPWLAYLYVIENYRSRGVAAKLITKCSQILKGLGYKEAYVKADKQAAMDFCKSMGWELFETIKDTKGNKTEIYKLLV